MFKNHPKGLLPAALANMGERFGFYTMMAILTLFLMSKFGLDKTNAGLIYSVFYFSIYILAFVGGLIADKTRNYKGTILVGLIVMALGYLLIAVPTPTPVRNVPLFLTVTCVGLFTIAFGNGLFKGNLQALVGQMYDNEKYEKMRDSGFSLFYMFINVGAIFAPLAAVGMRNGWLSSQGFLYDPDLPELCHGFLRNSLSPEATARFQELAATVSKNGAPTDMTAFADGYLGAFATGFHFAFGIAIFAMLISLGIYLANKRKLPDPRKLTASGATSDPHTVRMAAAEVKKRIWALIAVYAVVIFFWFSFHQNGLTLTFFAKDYTLLKIGSLDLSAEIFQSMNPFFVVFLTPAVLAFFGWMRANGREPSTPAKMKTRRHEVAPKPDPKPPGFRPAAGFSRRSAPGFSFPGYDRIRKRFSVFGNLRGADAQFGRPGTPALNVPTAIPADQSHPFPNAVFEPGNKKLIVTVVFHGIRSQAGGRCDRDEPRQPSRFFIH